MRRGAGRVALTALAAIATPLGSGCEQWKAPERLRELEGRVNDLSAAVSALTGKPVGAKPGAAEEGAGSGEDSEHGSGDAKRKRPDREERDEHRDRDRDRKAPPKDRPRGAHDAAEDHDGRGPRAESARDEPARAPARKRDAHWSYAGATGPEAWASLDPDWASCDGRAQSPIDIEPRASKASAIEFHYQPTAATVVDTGHTLQVSLAPGSRIEIDGEPYDLAQLHVHTPSEHSIAGERYAMELHLVHKNGAGRLAVVGVMFDQGAEAKALEPIWSRWPAQPKLEQKLKQPFDPTALLPEVRTAYQYEGSLTTPPCTEGVSWNVLRRTLTLSRAQLDTLQRRYRDNARPVMPLGERAVL